MGHGNESTDLRIYTLDIPQMSPMSASGHQLPRRLTTNVVPLPPTETADTGRVVYASTL